MPWPDQEKIRHGVASMLEVNLAVRDGERVLIMTDPVPLNQWHDLRLERLVERLGTVVLARMVADLAAELLPRSEITFLPYAAVERHGAEPDAETAKKMRAADVIVAINNHSLTHTVAAEEACQAGARMASMPGFRASMFEGPMMADHDLLAEESRKMAELLTEAKTAILTSSLGTSLALDLRGRSGHARSGLITSAGERGNLPGGEAFIAPLEGRGEGELVVHPDGHPKLGELMTVRFKDGEAWDIEGGDSLGEDLSRLLELPQSGRQPARRNLAELGVGTNPKARSVESTLEAEKIKGTVHIAIGDNIHMGGIVRADLHEDFVLWEPDLSLDGRVVIREGAWLV